MIYLPYASGLLHKNCGYWDSCVASEITLKDMANIYLDQSTTKHNKAWTHWMVWMMNSLVLVRWGGNFKRVIFKLITQNSSLGTWSEIVLRQMPQNLTNEKSALVQVMAWCRQATSHYLTQYWSRFMSKYGITRPQRVNSLWPNDAIWRHRSGSTLAQVMACCLTAPSHHLNQCWLIISKIQLHSSEGNFTRYTPVIND